MTTSPTIPHDRTTTLVRQSLLTCPPQAKGLFVGYNGQR